MDGNVVLIAGLPGCGKTTLLHRMCQEGWWVFDDWKAGAPDLLFRNSPKLRDLIGALRDGRRCAVADIDFCDTNARNEAEGMLREEISGLDVRWEFFANDRSACEANARARNRSCLQRELNLIVKYSHSYNIPEGAVVHPVWQKL
jgi:hypothetical protein